MKPVYTLLFFSCFVLHVQAQQDPGLKAGINKNVLDMIEKLKGCKSIDSLYTDGSTRSVKSCGNNAIISVKAYDNMLLKYVNWYFTNDSLIYCDMQWFDPETKRQTEYQECYVKNNTLLAWIDNDQREVDSKSEKFRQMEKELPVYANKFLKNVRR